MTAGPRSADPTTNEPADPDAAETGSDLVTTGRLGELLEYVLQGEPELGNQIDAVFRRADALRRRRIRLVLGAGAAVVAVMITTGYLLTSTLLPAAKEPTPPAATPVATPAASVAAAPPAESDPVLAVISAVAADDHIKIIPGTPGRGSGWRQYDVLDLDERPHGTIEVAVYSRPGGLCLPKPQGGHACAHARRAGDDREYVRYDYADDPDWQVNQTIGRRTTDGRTVAVMAAGERNAEDGEAARPPLSGAEVREIATDARLFSAFEPSEQCDEGQDGEGRGDERRGDERRGDQGRGDEGRGDEGRGDQGRGDGGRGDHGRGDEGQGHQGQDDRDQAADSCPIFRVPVPGAD